jgi:hypothetical protein
MITHAQTQLVGTHVMHHHIRHACTRSRAHEPWQVTEILSVVIKPERLPVYIHCLDGADVTGVVIACLRRLQVRAHRACPAVLRLPYMQRHSRAHARNVSCMHARRTCVCACTELASRAYSTQARVPTCRGGMRSASPTSFAATRAPAKSRRRSSSSSIR